MKGRVYQVVQWLGGGTSERKSIPGGSLGGEEKHVKGRVYQVVQWLGGRGGGKEEYTRWFNEGGTNMHLEEYTRWSNDMGGNIGKEEYTRWFIEKKRVTGRVYQVVQ